MQITYLILIFTTLLLLVSVCLTPSSGRTYVFLTQNHLLLQSYCIRYIGWAIKICNIQFCWFTVFL